LIALALVLASERVIVGDTFCGQVLWDRQPADICATDIASKTRTVVAVAVAVFAGAILIAAARQRIAAALWVIAAVALVVVANRALDPPLKGSGCGSLVNPMTFPGQLDEDRCDQALADRTWQVAGASAAAIMLAVGGQAVRIATARRRTAE
jgi:hypothetical protein